MQEQINLDELSVEQLEALCFRLVEQQTNINRNLQMAQQELNNNLQTAQQELNRKRKAPAPEDEPEIATEDSELETDIIEHDD